MKAKNITFIAQLLAVVAVLISLGIWIGFSTSPDDVAADVSGHVWTEQTASFTDNWKSVAMSEDGRKIAAVVENGSLYTSADGGVTWIERTAAGSRAWNSIAMSYDGMKIAAVDFGGYIHMSDDGGVTWEEQVTAPQGEWNSIAMSGDGDLVIAAGDGMNIYTTDSWGVEWTEHDVFSQTSWRALATSESGDRVVAVSNGYIYMSNNGGNDWTEETDPGQYQWETVDVSRDGDKVLAAAHGIPVFLWTNDSGWSELDDSGKLDWSAVTISLDGEFGAAAVSGGPVYAVLNNFSEWEEQDGVPQEDWRAIASSDDFSEMVLAGVGTHIFTSTNADVTAPVISSISSNTPTSLTATITWSTDESATSRVFYGTTTAYASSTVLNATLTTNHTVGLTGLIKNTSYHFVVVSSDDAGNTATSTDRTFSTADIAMVSDGGGVIDDEGGGGGDDSGNEMQGGGGGSSGGGSSVSTKVPEKIVTDPCARGYKNPRDIKTFASGVLIITRDLKLCNEGDDVRVLQNFLISKGYLEGISTGYFSDETEKAIAQFKEDLGLEEAVDIVGPYTRGLLYLKSLEEKGGLAINSLDKVNPLLLPPALVLTRDFEFGASGPDVVYLQKFLTDKGFLAEGHLSAYFGELTKAALIAYQQSRGIEPAIGYFGPRTRADIINYK